MQRFVDHDDGALNRAAARHAKLFLTQPRCAAAPLLRSTKQQCLAHISKCVSVQFFPLLKSSVFYSLALKKGSNNFAPGSSFCSPSFCSFFLLFLVGSFFSVELFYLFL